MYSFMLNTAQNVNFKKRREFYLCKIMKSQQDLEKNVLLKVAPMHHEEYKILQYAPCHPDWGPLMVVFRMKVLYLHCKEDNVADDRGSHTQFFCWATFLTNMRDRLNLYKIHMNCSVPNPRVVLICPRTTWLFRDSGKQLRKQRLNYQHLSR